MNLVRYACFISLFIVLVCCENPTIGHAYHHIEGEVWGKNDTISLELPVTDSLLYNCQLHILVRNNGRFPYQELPVGIRYSLPGSGSWTTDSLRFVLADPKGKWLGAGWSGLYQSSLFLKNVQIIKKGDCRLKIIYLLPDEALVGVTDIGVLLKK